MVHLVMCTRKIFLLSLFIFIRFYNNAQDTIRKENIHLKINLQGALIINNSLSNLDYGQLYPASTNWTTYSRLNSKPMCFGFTSGVEFLIGKNKGLKQILGCTFELTNSAFNHHFNTYDRGYGHREGDTASIDYNRRVLFGGLNYGLMLSPSKHFSFCLLVGLNKKIEQKDILNGYEITYASYSFSPGSFRDSVNYTDKVVYSKGAGNGLMGYLRFRIIYKCNEFLSVLGSANVGLGYVAPWWMIGVQYYPFRKLR